MLLNKDMITIMLLSVFAGGAGMVLDILVFAWLFQRLYMNPFLANAIAISAGTILSFVLNILFIFKVRDKMLRRFLIFYSTGIFGILLSSGILWLGDMMHLPVFPVKVFSVFFVAVVQFFLNYFFAFDGSKHHKSIK